MKESLGKNLNLKNDYRVAYIKCDCDNEILVVRYDAELDMVDLCIFESQNSFNEKSSLWQKLRYVYNLFKTGQPFTDQIVLKKDQVEELKGFLNSL